MPLPLLLPILGGLALVGLVAVAGGGKAADKPTRARPEPEPEPEVDNVELRIGVHWVGESEPGKVIGHPEFSAAQWRDGVVIADSFRGGMSRQEIPGHIAREWQGGALRFWLSTNTSGDNRLPAQHAINDVAANLDLDPAPTQVSGMATIQ